MAAVLHQALELELNADSTEFCPWPESLDLLAVGTYQLDEATQSRLGRLHLYTLHAAHADNGAGPSYSLGLEDMQDMPGIFDLKWAPCGARSCMLGAALADGTLRLLEVERPTSRSEPEEQPGSRQQQHQQQHQQRRIKEASRCQATSEGSMVLSLDWQQGIQASMPKASSSTLLQAEGAGCAFSSAEASLSRGAAVPTGLKIAASTSGGDLSVINVSHSHCSIPDLPTSAAPLSASPP
jgi:hypothetical protein